MCVCVCVNYQIIRKIGLLYCSGRPIKCRPNACGLRNNHHVNQTVPKQILENECIVHDRELGTKEFSYTWGYGLKLKRAFWVLGGPAMPPETMGERGGGVQLKKDEMH